MKKTGLFVSALLISWTISGQSAYDYLLKARALNQGGKPSEAIALLTEVVNNINDYRLFLESADSKVLTGDYKGAVEDYNRANTLKTSSGEYGLARIYALQNDAAGSINHLEKSMKSPFKKSEKDIMLDAAFAKLENRPEWRQFWKNEWYSNAEKGVREVEYYVFSGKQEEARSAQSELRSIYPDYDDVKYCAALIEFSSGKYQDAIKDLNSLTSSETTSEKYMRLLGRTQVALANFAGASETYSRLIGIETPDAGLFLQRAECFRKTGEWGKSMNDIEKYLTFYPDDKIALSMAGKVEVASGDNLKAIEYFSKNLKVHPNDADCYIDRANAYLVSRSWKWAISDYSMSLDLDPGNSDTWLNKGIALVNTGKTDDACHDFREAMDLGNKRAAEYISKYCIK
jgi:tetratricopeptide (TPR) repeat protein